MAKSPDWGGLPLDIVDVILSKLLTLSDYLRFSIVCKEWFYICEKQKHFRFDPYNKQLPLLFIPAGHEKKPSLYNAITNKIYDTQEIQWDCNTRCRGSCFGWLATVDKDHSLSITNPFLGKTIKFPPVSKCLEVVDDDFDSDEDDDIDHDEDGDEDDDSDHDEDEEDGPYAWYKNQIRKVILTKDPILFPNDFVVVAIHYHFLKFSCIKVGDDSWVEVDDKGLRPFSDVIIHNDLLYAVGHRGGVGSLDITGNMFDISLGTKLQVIIPNKMKFAEIAYLVESSQGELLQIRRFLNDLGTKYKTHKFDIFKLLTDDDDGGGGKKIMKWSQVVNLGEDSLFVGDNYSTSISMANFPNGRSNCIYFTDNYHDNGYPPPSESFDNGIYDVANGSFATHYIIPSSHKYLPPPIWILPT